MPLMELFLAFNGCCRFCENKFFEKELTKNDEKQLKI